MLPVFVINNYGQFNHLILRTLRDLDIDAQLVPNTTPPDDIRMNCRGIILGGGPEITRAGRSHEYLHLGKPVLGICLGLHVIAQEFGGTVQSGQKAGMGQLKLQSLTMIKYLRGILKRSRLGLACR
jgi:GMP synthase (glutamine-hydrolysing)